MSDILIPSGIARLFAHAENRATEGGILLVSI